MISKVILTIRALVFVITLVIASFGQSASPSVASPSNDKDDKKDKAELQPDRSAFTFSDYDLEIRITPAKSLLEARGKLSLKNDSGSPQTLAALQLSSTLKWGSFRSGSDVLQFHSRELDSDVDHTGSVNEAVVRLAHAVPPGQSVDINVTYSGAVGKNSNRLERVGAPLDVAMQSDWDGISTEFTGLRGVGYVLWYPVALEPALLRDGNKVFREIGEWKARHAGARLRLSLLLADSGAAILSNGSQTKVAGAASTIRWEPVNQDVPFFTIGKWACANCPATFQIWSTQPESELIKKWDEELKKVEPPVSGAQKIHELLIQLPDPESPPFESGNVFLTPIKEVPSQTLDVMLVHPLVHTTFYSRRPWIQEGVAHLAQALLRAQQEGRQAGIDYLDQRRGALALQEPAVDAAGKSSGPGQSLVEATDEIYYRGKAAYVWWMLQDIIGTEAMQKALSAYDANLDKEPSYLQRLLEMHSKKDLEWFFDDWVYRDKGLPEFKIASVFTGKTLSGTFLVTVTVENSGAAAAEVPVFIHMKSGAEASARIFVKGHDKGTTRIPVPHDPVEARVNDGSIPEVDPGNNTAVIANSSQDHL